MLPLHLENGQPQEDNGYNFPGQVELMGLSPVSEALMGRRRWESPEVEHDRNAIQGPTGRRLNQWLDDWRSWAAAKAIEAFQLVKGAEKEAFGPNSYFRQQEEMEQLE